jgi:transketolase N-terminal domain/subunit
LTFDKADHALLDFAPGALQCRADVLGLFDIFGVAAQGLGHLVVARVAEIAARLAARRDPLGRRAGDCKFRAPVDPTFVPGHRLNSGPFGTMGVGLPFAVGAKAAKPDAQVICLHGDGSFGQNAMELDTAVRHKLPLLCIISLNGGWTADPERNA